MRPQKKYFTVVYRWMSSARTRDLMSAPDAVAGAHTHALRERDCWKEMVEMSQVPHNVEEIAQAIERIQQTDRGSDVRVSGGC
jgi:superfamily II RNA helicase